MYIAKCSLVFRSGIKDAPHHFNMPVAQVSLDSAFPDDEDYGNEDFGTTSTTIKKQESH
jgi:hypothetical protein